MPSSNKQNKKSTTPKYGAGWKSGLTDLPLPSGELCQVKRPGVQGLIKSGVLESLDSLTGIVSSETIPKAQGKPQTDVEAIMSDPEKYKKMMETVDKIVLHVVVQPKLHADTVTEAMALDPDLPAFTQEDVGRDLTDEEMQDLGWIFLQYVDEFDKMFIMNFVVGGSRDLEEFRAATKAAVGSPSAGEGVPDEG